ncbi:MAG: hypothetical protein LUD15_02475 [Bacteroides sp.]|nr:hypothetical protein [Bacteroides sp.]
MKKIVLFITCLAAITTARSQIAPTDTMTISYKTYMEIVARENLTWMAEKYNVQIADAEARSEKVFVDPELAFEGTEEELSVALEFTLEMGKRRARVLVACSEAKLERLAFDYFCLELRAEATDAFLEALLQRQLLEVKRNSYQQMYRLSQSDSIRLSLGEIDENEAR